MINDVDALTAPGAMEAVANSRCAVCLMHKKGEPATMQRDPHYDDVVREVREFLKNRVHGPAPRALLPSALPSTRVSASAKPRRTTSPSSRIWRPSPTCRSWRGSRKSTLGRITGRVVEDRLAGSLAMALLALQAGAAILRVHDVVKTRDVIAVWQAYTRES